MAFLRATFGWVFHALYITDFSNSPKSMNEWRAMGGVVWLQINLIGMADLWMEMTFGRTVVLSMPKPAIAVGILALVVANYAAFLRGGTCDALMRAHAALPRRSRRTRLILAWVFMAAVLVLLGVTLLHIHRSVEARFGHR